MKGVMVFSEGEIVGKVREFKTVEAFIEAAKTLGDEYGRDSEIKPEDVKRTYIRWYINPPDGWGIEYPDGCYIETGRPGRGAFECFITG